MRLLHLALGAVLLLAPSLVRAADLEVTVRAAKGAPLGDAVVTVKPERGGGGVPARYGDPLVLTQRDLQFAPFVLVVPQGAEVRFPNEDTVRHQVYSFSPAKTFELKLYGRDQTRAVRFETPGVVAVGCNIHDQMTAFIKVVATPYAAKTDRAGRVMLRGLPAGAAMVKVWHPYAKGEGEIALTVDLPATGVVARDATLAVRPPPMRMTGY